LPMNGQKYPSGSGHSCFTFPRTRSHRPLSAALGAVACIYPPERWNVIAAPLANPAVPSQVPKHSDGAPLPGCPVRMQEHLIGDFRWIIANDEDGIGVRCRHVVNSYFCGQSQYKALISLYPLIVGALKSWSAYMCGLVSVSI
jgi:hypothetical protein